jgi:rare lipoprotein A
MGQARRSCKRAVPSLCRKKESAKSAKIEQNQLFTTGLCSLFVQRKTRANIPASRRDWGRGMSFRGIGHFGRVVRLLAICLGGLALANCSGGISGKIDPKYGVSASARVVEPGQAVPKGGGVYRVGKPYVVAGRTYVPEFDPNYSAVGLASWYGADFHGRYTANGEIFDKEAISAAHPTLPLPSYVRVTNLSNHKSIVVRVNDRGPYVGNRLIDVSSKTAALLGFQNRGTAKVKVDYVGRAPLQGSDDRKLIATLRENTSSDTPVQLASNAPFAPTYFDSRSSAGVSVRLPANVPPPVERPYDLGKDASVGTFSSRQARYENAGLRRASFEQPASDPQVSAYAGSRDETRGSSFMSGRGLY